MPSGKLSTKILAQGELNSRRHISTIAGNEMMSKSSPRAIKTLGEPLEP
jgi:hypothetical protein